MNEKNINKNLFKGIYEIYNIDTNTVSDIVVADSEQSALPNGNENQRACSFFEQERTIEDLEEELKAGDLELNDVLKSVEDLFYMCFDNEDYEIKLVHGNSDTRITHSQQYIVVDKVQGMELVFDVDSDKYDIFYVSASGILFANTYSCKSWCNFVNLLHETHFFLHEWNYGEDDE